MPTIIRHFEFASIAAGSTFSTYWDADADYTIKYIMVRTSDAATLTATKITIRVGNKPYTYNEVPAAVLGSDYRNALPLDIPIRSGERLEISGTNGEGAAKTFYVDVVLEPAS